MATDGVDESMQDQLPCTRCTRLVPRPAEVPADGVLCLTCQIVTAPPPVLSASDLRVKRRLWLWLAGVAALGVGVAAAAFVSARAKQRDRFESTYPVAASASDRVVLSREATPWAKGKTKLLASLGSFDSSVVRVAPDAARCPLAQNVATDSQVEAVNTDLDLAPESFSDLMSTARDPDRDVGDRLLVGPGLQQSASQHLETMLAAARRGRFRSQDGRLRVVDALDDDALVVLELFAERRPELDRESAKLEMSGGFRSGYAFAFDRETGELRCAGTFEASSSQRVKVLVGEMGAIGNELDGVRRDFEAQTDRAIAAALRVVTKPDDPKGRALGVDPTAVPLTSEHAAELEAGCTKGDATSCVALSQAMRRGELPDDPVRRLELLRRGCDGGSAFGCYVLGIGYVRGYGVARDVDVALQHLQKACDGKQYSACEAIGLLYSEGDGVTVDAERAATYYVMGCDGGHAASCSNLGYLAEAGDDLERAAALYTKACAGENAYGCRNLSRLHDEGRGVEKNPALVLEYVTRACELGDSEACASAKRLKRP